ncbi:MULTISPECIES: DUF2199 domain-containing protein [unclassified Kitasatospora]|uniref:DUF2199 domain-containing protein n=1 Tax=unclassified Kitasatospora TaxID=2633591 RepID=UPI002473BB70|nr:DUF2199 domain-containing protein [Kitasatospora sp. GAS204B]
MSSTAHTFTCSCCHGEHAGPALSHSAKAPDLWHPQYAEDTDSMLTADLCSIKGQALFIHGLIEIPVRDTGEIFSWGVWSSLSAPNFARAVERWQDEDRDQEPAYFGWLSTELPLYGVSTMILKTQVHTRPLGRRPFIELEPTDHPLAVEQREGITAARVAEIAELVLRQGRIEP